MLKIIVITTTVIAQISRCLKNHLHGWAQIVVVIGLHSTWRLVTIGVSQESVPAPAHDV